MNTRTLSKWFHTSYSHSPYDWGLRKDHTRLFVSQVHLLYKLRLKNTIFYFVCIFNMLDLNFITVSCLLVKSFQKLLEIYLLDNIIIRFCTPKIICRHLSILFFCFRNPFVYVFSEILENFRLFNAFNEVQSLRDLANSTLPSQKYSNGWAKFWA